MTRPVRWLVTGAGGRLGRALVDALDRRPGVLVTPADRRVLDVTDRAAVAEVVSRHDIVLNAAAWTDVDAAERDEASATVVNGAGVGHLARACAASRACLVQVSTDYVFSGRATTPYAEDATPDPINAYGRSKLAGERAVLAELPGRGFVVRTAWLYGHHGGSFLRTVLRGDGSVRVVDDQHGQPTSVAALTRQLIALGAAAVRGEAAPGVYHGTSAGQTSWYELARAGYRLAGLDPGRVRPVSSAEFPRAAARPAYSVLAHRRWAACGIAEQPHWHDQLAAFLREA